MSHLNTIPEVNVCLLLFSVLVTLCLLIGAIADSGRKRPFMQSFICLLIVNILSQFGESGMWAFEGMSNHIWLLNVCCVLSYGVGALVHVFFCYCLVDFSAERQSVSKLPAHMMAAACNVILLLSVISVYNGMFFAVDKNGMVVDGPWGFVVNVFDFVAFLVEVLLIIRYRDTFTVRGMSALLTFSVLPFGAMLLAEIWYPTPVYLTTTLSLIVLFILFHGELTKQLATKEKELRKKETELAETRINVLMSQIEPHFLFNSLSTIRHLCRKEPQEAMEAVDKFSGFLRGSMDALKQSSCVTFERELEFVNNYLYLEKKRFGDRLQIRFDIQAEGFLVPPLSIQTIAENAVRHGISGKLEGGTLTISSWEEQNNFVVSVTDDGIGFLVEETPGDGKEHLGIWNTRNRLAMMCDGSLEVHSVPGIGTQVTFFFPKRMEKDHMGKEVGE